MSKCVKCMQYFHPDWCVEENIRGDDVIVCCFCKVDKTELTVTDEDDKIVERVTKDQANREYMEFLRELSKKPKISEILVKGTNEK